MFLKLQANEKLRETRKHKTTPRHTQQHTHTQHKIVNVYTSAEGYIAKRGNFAL